MTNVLRKADDGIVKLYGFATRTKKKAFFTGIVIYTLMFAGEFFLTLLPTIIDQGSLMASDGISQYYPFLLDFRNSLLTFFDNLSKGEFSFPFVNFNYSYGAAPLPSPGDFLPYLPYYVFVALIPESWVAAFYGFGTVLLLYISGISFIYMCSYFEKNTMIAGFFSFFYVFCINTFFTSMYNQHFMCMYIAFPLLIAGIDKIISKKGFMMFVLTTAWLSMSGIPYIVYTIPFVVLFAIIRVRYVYKDHYFKNLGICFVKGFSSFILGIGIAGIIFVPGFIDFMTSNRSVVSGGLSLSTLLTPSLDYLSDWLVNWIPGQVGVATSVLPFILFFTISDKSSQQHKLYMFIMSVLVSLPLIYYGLNGFQYTLCRWGFIPAALLCYLGVSTVQDFINSDKKHTILFTVAGLVYFGLILLKYRKAAALFMVVLCIINLITPLKRFLSGLWDKFTVFYKQHRAAHLAIPFLVFILFMLILFSIASNGLQPEVVVIVSFVAAIVFIWCYYKTGLKGLTSLCLVIALSVSTYFYLSYQVYVSVPVTDIKTELNELKSMVAGHTKDDSFRRISLYRSPSPLASIVDEMNDEESDEIALKEKEKALAEAAAKSDSQNDEPTTASGKAQYYAFESDPQTNLGLRYNFPDSLVFQSILNKSLVGVLKRAGVDSASATSKVDTTGFSDNYALYSLFGLSAFCYDNKEELPVFGCEDNYDVIHVSDKDLYVYYSKYAYPTGVTYSNVISADEFYSLNTAEYPHAMMEAVYLNGSPLSANAAPSGKKYARRVNITHEKESRGTTSYGIECFNNTITIDEDVSDCLLYVTFEGVSVIANEVYSMQSVELNIDDKYVAYGNCENENNVWPWSLTNDRYNIPIGYHENGIKKITFISPFAYQDVYVTAVPREQFIAAYEACTEETLDNIQLSTNTLSGDITVSSDKVLSIDILYSQGWKAYVDGTETPVYAANDLFLGIPLTAGSHKIRIEYTYPNSGLGFAVTVVSLFITVGAVIIVSRKKKNNNIVQAAD